MSKYVIINKESTGYSPAYLFTPVLCKVIKETEKMYRLKQVVSDDDAIHLPIHGRIAKSDVVKELETIEEYEPYRLKNKEFNERYTSTINAFKKEVQDFIKDNQ